MERTYELMSSRIEGAIFCCWNFWKVQRRCVKFVRRIRSQGRRGQVETKLNIKYISQVFGNYGRKDPPCEYTIQRGGNGLVYLVDEKTNEMCLINPIQWNGIYARMCIQNKFMYLRSHQISIQIHKILSVCSFFYWSVNRSTGLT